MYQIKKILEYYREAIMAVAMVPISFLMERVLWIYGYQSDHAFLSFLRGVIMAIVCFLFANNFIEKQKARRPGHDMGFTIFLTIVSIFATFVAAPISDMVIEGAYGEPRALHEVDSYDMARINLSGAELEIYENPSTTKMTLMVDGTAEIAKKGFKKSKINWTIKDQRLCFDNDSVCLKANPQTGELITPSGSVIGRITEVRDVDIKNTMSRVYAIAKPEPEEAPKSTSASKQ